MRLANPCSHFLRVFMDFFGKQPGILDSGADDYYSKLPVNQANICQRIFTLPLAGPMDLFFSNLRLGRQLKLHEKLHHSRKS